MHTSDYFSDGTEIQLSNGGFLNIIGKIGEGGQGVVYKVRYKNNVFALKWYHSSTLKDINVFYR